MSGIDQVQLNFNADSIVALNALLAMIMFGVGLDIHWRDLRALAARWPIVLIGLFAQLLLLPLLTVLLALWLRPSPSLALGMVIIAACPGGTVSNFFSHLARGDIALSVTLSTFTSAVCFFTTPFNIAYWGGWIPEVRTLLEAVSVDWRQMLLLVLAVLLLPASLGATLAAKRPRIASRLRVPFRRFSIAAFAIFVLGAFVANQTLFIERAGDIVGIVALHNVAALVIGFITATIFQLSDKERRSISIEVGIQNTALGLAVIFTFFDGLGGTALITAWWGVWHLLTGAALGYWWSRRPIAEPVSPGHAQ